MKLFTSFTLSTIKGVQILPKKSFNTIEIPEGSLVLMCGATNTGKTTFVKKHFEGRKNTDIFCSDDLFMEVVRKSSIFDTYDSVIRRTEENLVAGILKSIELKHTVVLDSVSYRPELRKANIDAFRPYFKNIVMIVIDLDIPDLLTHGSKPVIPEKVRFDLYPPKPEHNVMLALGVKAQIQNGQIREGIDTLHIITSDTLNNTQIVIK